MERREGDLGMILSMSKGLSRLEGNLGEGPFSTDNHFGPTKVRLGLIHIFVYSVISRHRSKGLFFSPTSFLQENSLFTTELEQRSIRFPVVSERTLICFRALCHSDLIHYLGPNMTC